VGIEAKGLVSRLLGAGKLGMELVNVIYTVLAVHTERVWHHPKFSLGMQLVSSENSAH
jgi:hypothetical protein